MSSQSTLVAPMSVTAARSCPVRLSAKTCGVPPESLSVHSRPERERTRPESSAPAAGSTFPTTRARSVSHSAGRGSGEGEGEELALGRGSGGGGESPPPHAVKVSASAARATRAGDAASPPGDAALPPGGARRRASCPQATRSPRGGGVGRPRRAPSSTNSASRVAPPAPVGTRTDSAA